MSCSSAENAIVFTMPSNKTSILKSMFSNSIFPASTFEKSKMSLMIFKRDLALLCAMAIFRAWSLFSSLWVSRPNMPITPLIGVRIS